jgi:penicillin-binding protein 2
VAAPRSNLLDDSHYRASAARWLLLFVSLMAALLALRLFYLQIIKGSYHEMLSAQNSLRLQVVKAARGMIYDRHGVVIARNRPSYQIALLPTELKNRQEILEKLLRFRDSTGHSIFDSEVVAWSLERSRWRKFQPLVIFEDAPFEVASLIEEHQTDLPGVVTLLESRRTYPFGAAAGHTLGYMDEVREGEIEDSKTRAAVDGSTPYQRGDRIGRKGLERKYENYFRGKDGIRYVKVNAFGKEMEAVSDMPHLRPEAGKSIRTTLDMGLQCYAESLLSDSLKGALVALDPRNGEILVMASSPRMDGNIFSLNRDRRARAWAKLALDPSLPLNNRSISGSYEPGSTFKGIVSIAALQSGKIRAENHMSRACNGGYAFGNRVWKCWDPRGHGFLDLVGAFTQSCDVYYYQAGLVLGMDRINRVAREFGLGRKTGIDLDDERSGLLVDSASYAERFGQRGWNWSRGLILNLSIGQGEIATPLQLANYAAGLANGKVLYRPHLMREMRSVEGSVEMQVKPEILNVIRMTPQEHAIILQAMEQVVISPNGTAGRARVPGVRVGGKTGSAENPQGDKTHALFICAAPLDNPTIAVAVVLENAGHGGSFAAPIAGALLRRFFGHEPHG